MPFSVKAAARDSALSQKQVEEVQREMERRFLKFSFEMTWVKTRGDLDLTTKLEVLDRTDFFTDAIDRLVLDGTVDVGIHSAKDLPDPLPKNLTLAAVTKGVDPSDVLVMRNGYVFDDIKIVGTSSLRRKEMLKAIKPTITCVSIRGTIDERLELLKNGTMDAVIMAKAALIRLNLLSLNYLTLKGETAPLQGQLAIVCRENHDKMKELFSEISVFRNRSFPLST